jgi:hypothetical protein
MAERERCDRTDRDHQDHREDGRQAVERDPEQFAHLRRSR